TSRQAMSTLRLTMIAGSGCLPSPPALVVRRRSRGAIRVRRTHFLALGRLRGEQDVVRHDLVGRHLARDLVECLGRIVSVSPTGKTKSSLGPARVGHCAPWVWSGATARMVSAGSRSWRRTPGRRRLVTRPGLVGLPAREI